MLFFQLDLPHRALRQHNPLIMFWISQVLFNLVDLPFKGEMLIIMTISHKWNWSSPLCFYCGYFLFIWTDVSYSQESVSSAGIIPQGCCFSYSTTTIPRWWSEELKLCQLDSLAMALKKKKQSMGCSGFSRTSQLASRRCFFESGCCIFNDVCFVVFAMWCTFIFSNFMQVFTPTFSQTRAKLT